MKLYYETSDSLMHYGVPGMKWGVRKKYPASDTRKRFDSAKAKFKSADKAYSKEFNKAYRLSSNGYATLFSEKRRQKADEQWDKAVEANLRRAKAKVAYKKATQQRKSAIKKNYDKVSKNSSLFEKIVYNEGTRKKIAKLMTDYNMSLEDARKRGNREALANTAAILAAVGSYTAYQHLKNR